MIGIGGKIGISLIMWMIWMQWLPDLWKMGFPLLQGLSVFILLYLVHLLSFKFLGNTTIIGQLHLLFVDKLEMKLLDCFQGIHFFFQKGKIHFFWNINFRFKFAFEKILLKGLVQLRIGFGDLGLKQCSHCAILMKLGVWYWVDHRLMHSKFRGSGTIF